MENKARATTGEKQLSPPCFGQHLNKKRWLRWHGQRKPNFTLEMSFS